MMIDYFRGYLYYFYHLVKIELLCRPPPRNPPDLRKPGTCPADNQIARPARTIHDKGTTVTGRWSSLSRGIWSLARALLSRGVLRCHEGGTQYLGYYIWCRVETRLVTRGADRFVTDRVGIAPSNRTHLRYLVYRCPVQRQTAVTAYF